MEMDRIKSYGSDTGGAMLVVCTPADEGMQSCGNGQMVDHRKARMLCITRQLN